MEKRKVLVTISGTTGSGKTTISRLIEKALRDANVEHEYKDDPVYLIEERAVHKASHSDERVAEIASEHVTVEIRERQLARSAQSGPSTT